MAGAEAPPMMTTNRKRIAIIAIAIILAALAIFLTTRTASKEIEVAADPKTVDHELIHRRETWISALEWCESRGFKEAINPKDRDGTPSYYSWQFKPDTFRYYGLKYGLIPESVSDAEVKASMKNYELTREIVRHMIDDPKVVWLQEFPDCISKKVGLPPIR